MKKLLTLWVILLILFSNINISYWNNDSKTIKYLINYVNDKNSDIEKIQKKYNLEEDKEIKEKLKRLKEIKNLLLKTSKTWEYNDYISKIIEQLKNNNSQVKEIFKEKIKEKKQEVQEYRIIYKNTLDPVIKKIDGIIINIAKKLVKKEKFNYKDKQIISILTLIKQRLNELENLDKKEFNNKKDLREYIMFNFKQITNNFRQIKKIVKLK